MKEEAENDIIKKRVFTILTIKGNFIQ